MLVTVQEGERLRQRDEHHAPTSEPMILQLSDGSGFSGLQEGALVSPAFAERFAAGLQECRVVPLGAGAHYLQEDHPDAIGRSVAEWIREIEAR